MKQNKKGTMILIMTVVGFILALVTFFILITYTKPESGEIVYHVGEKQLAVLKAYVEGEKAMFYVDEAAESAAHQAAYDLASKGGFYEEPECGSYLGSNRWSGEMGYCYPADLSETFKDNFQFRFLRSLLINPMQIPPEYEISVSELENKMQVKGVSQQDVSIPITIGAAEIKPFFVDLDLIWPTETKKISSCYGRRTISGKADFHDGVDIAVGTGTDVYAIGSGTVLKTCNKQACNEIKDKPNCPRACAGYGNYVIIKHTDTLYSKYSHLSQVLVNEGEQVEKGKVIAKSGDTGYSEAPHLDFKIFTSENFAPDVAKNPLCFYSDPFISTLSSTADSCKEQFGSPVRFKKPYEYCEGITFTPTEEISSELPLEVRDAVNQYDEYLYREADKKKVDVALVKAIITQESKGKADAISQTGCVGLGQFCFATARDYKKKGVFGRLTKCCEDSQCDRCNPDNDDRFYPEKNIIATTDYLGALLKRFEKYSDGMKFAVASYNGGMGLIGAAIKETTKEDPSWDDVAKQLTPELLRLYGYGSWPEDRRQAKIKEITGYVEKVVIYYKAWGGVISTSPIAGVMGNRIGTHHVKPSFSKEIKYNLKSYSNIQERIKNRIVSVCTAHENVKDCVKNQIDELNNNPNNNPEGYKYSLNCDESYEKVFYDFVENYQDCLETQDDNCVCSFSFDYKNNFGLNGNYKIRLEGKDDKTEITLTEPSYKYVQDFDIKTAQEMEFLFGYENGKLKNLEGRRSGLDWKYDNEIRIYKEKGQLSFVSPKEYPQYEGKRECKLNKRNFKFCVETGEKFLVYDNILDKTEIRPIQIKFGFYFRDTLPPPPLEETEVLDKKHAENQLIAKWRESPAADTVEYRIYYSKDDFSSQPTNWIRGNIPYYELNVESRDESFGEILLWEPTCVLQDGYCIFFYEGQKTKAPLASNVLYYLDNSKKYFYLFEVPEEGQHYVAITAVDIDGNEIDNVDKMQKIELYKNMQRAEAKDNLAPGLVTPVAYFIGENNKNIRVEWEEPRVSIDGSDLGEVPEYKTYYTTNELYKNNAAGMIHLATTNELYIIKPKNDFDPGTYYFAVVPFDEKGNGFMDPVKYDQLVI